MPSTKRKINIELSESELKALVELLYPKVYTGKVRNPILVAKSFLHKLSEAYYRDRLKKIELPSLDSQQKDYGKNAEERSMNFLMLSEAIKVLRKEWANPEVEMKLKDCDTDETVSVSINPIDVICIVPYQKGRKKCIYYIERKRQGDQIKRYSVNRDEFTFDKLIKKFDPLNKVLVQISHSAIVNLGYYRLSRNSRVKVENLNSPPKEIKDFDISNALHPEGLSYLDRFKLYRDEYLKNLLFHKKVIHYAKSKSAGSKQ